jgi:hypothetical protein
VFLFMVMYAPGGVASLIMMNLRVAKYGKLGRLWPSYLGLGGTALVALLGAACMVEMTYHLQLNAALGPEMTFMGASINAKGADQLVWRCLCDADWAGACSSCADASSGTSGGKFRSRLNMTSSVGRRCDHGA